MWRHYNVVLLPGVVLQGVCDDADPGWYTGADRSMEAFSRAREAYSNAMSSAEVGQYHKALTGFLTAVKELPEVTDAWANAATVYERLDRSSEAIALLRSAIRRRKPSRRGKLCTQLCGNLVRSYEMNGRVEDREAANKPCKCALELAPGDPRVHFSLGAWHAQRLEYPESIYHFEEGLRLQPNEYDVQNIQNLANVLLRSGEGERAIEMLREVLRDGKNSTGVHSMLSTAIQTVIPFSSEAIYHKRIAMLSHFASLPRGKGRRSCPFAVEIDPVTSSGLINTSSVGVASNMSLMGVNASMRLLNLGGDLVVFDGPPRTCSQCPTPPHIHDDGRYRDKAVWLITYHSVYMAGRTGTIFGDCVVFTGDHCYDSNAVQELTLETLKRGLSNHVKTVVAPKDRPVASAMQGKWYNHYHWLCESVSRIVMLAEHVLKTDPQTLLLVAQGERIINETLDLLGPDLIPRKRVIYWSGEPGTRHFFPTLHTIYYRSRDLKDTHHVNDPWYVYFPAVSALRQGREFFLRGIDRMGARSEEAAPLLYISRNDVGTRNVHGEARLVRLIHAHVGESFMFFQGKDRTLLQQLSIFRKASVLVGAQGSGLANFMSAKPGTYLVLFPMKPYDDNILAFVAVGLGLRIWMVPDLNAFYYAHYNATAHRCKQVLLTLKEVLAELQPHQQWASEALMRPQWAELAGSYSTVPSGTLWKDG